MSKRRPLPTEPVRVRIESLTHDGRGVVHLNGKTIFVDGALAGEDVDIQYIGRQRRYDEAKVIQIHTASPERVTPKCSAFGLCGGCAFQHLRDDAQIAAKQQVLLDNLQRIGHVTPQSVLPPLTGPTWGYRRKARLAVKYVIKKGRVLVGFREKHSPYVADIETCEVLHPSVAQLLPALRDLVTALSIKDQIPQFEVAVGDNATALIMRHLAPLNDADRAQLVEFARRHAVQFYVQPHGLDSIVLLWPEQGTLTYRLARYDVEFEFRPTLFTQVNADINAAMVDRALELLAPQPTDRVLDLFCGLGNFTLPIARHAAHVTGVEGEAGLVQTARDNARRNGIANVDYQAANLAEDVSIYPWARQHYDKILLDPPRSGAFELVKQAALWKAPRVAYVSCNPSTLARDAEVLVHTHGYRLVSAGVMDMFPHTAHVEAIALFLRYS
jgi:23S rRNA (uracil1939-C5)-methyltransferase